MHFQRKQLIFGAIAIVGVWYFLQPHSYEDCVMNGMSNAKTESAMSALRGACRKKFPSNYIATPTQPKDLLQITPPPVEFKTPPKVVTSFLGIDLGDTIPDLVYKLNDKRIDRDLLKKLVLMPYKEYWIDIKLDTKDRVDYVFLSCEWTTKQTDLNGIYCGTDEQTIKRKYGSSISTTCIANRPTVRIAYSSKYKTGYYLEASKVIGLAISSNTLGEPCP